jgi:type IV pilus assembly protein PilB
MASFDKRLKSILVKTGTLDEDSADTALMESNEAKTDLGDYLLDNGIVDERDMLCAISKEMRIPPIDLARVEVPEDAREALPQDLATYYGVVPLSKIENILTLAVANPFDVLKLDDVRIVTGCEIRPVVASGRSITEAIDRLYNQRQKEMEEMFADMEGGTGLEHVVDSDDTGELDLSALASGDEEVSPVIKLVNVLLADAIRSKTSDIHVEPLERRIRVRYRQDGVLREVMSPPKRMLGAVISRIKIMADLDIAERRRPQDGKFQMRMDGRQVDFRVSILPLIHGEKAVLRILDASNLALSLDTLGFESKCLDDFRWAVEQPYGMILVTGPTGSGKSTTLYSALKETLTIDDNVITVEDPVEYQLEGVNQVPVNVKRGLTFAAALRSILRQDPDTIMIGELRDTETMEIAIKAALTGHLVLSTLHTNDSASAVTRMIDMGVDPFMVASTCLVITAQRLGRRLCKDCKQAVDAPPKERLIELGLEPDECDGFQAFQPVGCASCASGYKGRFAIVETLRSSEPLQRLIIEGAGALDIKAHALTEGMVTLRHAAMLNASRGVTSIQEVLRVTMADA